MIFKYTLAWIPMVFIAIINGILRQSVYGKYVKELTAHQISTFTGIGLFALFTWLLSGWWKMESARQALTIGGIWLILTILFEFVFGHFVIRHPWSRLFQDYNLLAGRIWLLVLIATFLLPWIMYKIRA